MSAERSWPHRFRVRVQTNGGATIDYPVVSWLSREKAIALAVAAHLRRYPEGQAETRVHDVEVEDLGPVVRDAQGAVALERADIFDRMEF